MFSLDDVLKKLPLPVREFIEYGFCQNRWLWAHSLAGAIGGWLGGMIMSAWIVMIVAVIVAVGFELFEAKLQNKITRRFIYDSIGDISMELFLCWMSI